MCGIVAYIGERVASPILLNGLKRLEYRGYDSAGMALIEDGQIVFEKAAGKIKVLERKFSKAKTSQRQPVSDIPAGQHTAYRTM